MNIEAMTMKSNTSTIEDVIVHLPVQSPASGGLADPLATDALAQPRLHAGLIARLVENYGAVWVDEQSLDSWAAGEGDRVFLLAGDPAQFPEGLDVAVVLPELMRTFPGRFSIAVVPRAAEDAISKRFGWPRWPSLIFMRNGKYVTTISGMLDWDVYVKRFEEAFDLPTARPPTVGIPVVSNNKATSPAGCH